MTTHRIAGHVECAKEAAVLIAPDGPPILTPAAMRTAEAAAVAAGTPAELLMERAAAAAVLATERFAAVGEALVLCGPGNNGGDGYAVARRLQASGWQVRVAALPAASDLAKAMEGRWHGQTVALADARPAPLIIDALFGTGLTRTLEAAVQATLDRLRTMATTVVALDCPSGVDMTTGARLGNPLAADLTVAFGAVKIGHVLGDGRCFSGRVVVADIGLGAIACDLRLNPPPRLQPLAATVHKFARGHLLVIEGRAGQGGAARLAARAGLRAGAGVVTLVGAPSASPVDAIMCRGDADGRALLGDRRTTAVVIGPGLANDDRAAVWLAALLGGATPVLLDAGALTVFAGRPEALAAATAPLILTPHDGEFAKVFGPAGEDRVAAARRAAVLANAVIVLKGAESIIAAPDGRAAINLHATPWLATAGSGDVLAGIIGGLLAQGLTPFDAARAGTWLHGDAGRRCGPGLVADDLPDRLPAVLAAL